VTGYDCPPAWMVLTSTRVSDDGVRARVAGVSSAPVSGRTTRRNEECREPGRITGRGASLTSGGEGDGFGGGPKEGVHISGRLPVQPEDKATNLAESAESARDRARRAAVVPPRLGEFVELACLQPVIGVDRICAMRNGTATAGANARDPVRRPPGVYGLDVDESKRRWGASAPGGSVVSTYQREDNAEHRIVRL
jgi:hypothetical protein